MPVTRPKATTRICFDYLLRGIQCYKNTLQFFHITTRVPEVNRGLKVNIRGGPNLKKGYCYTQFGKLYVSPPCNIRMIR